MCYKLIPLQPWKGSPLDCSVTENFKVSVYDQDKSIPGPVRRQIEIIFSQSFSHVSSQSKFKATLHQKMRGVNKITSTESHKMQWPQLWNNLNALLYTTEEQLVKRFLAGQHESSHLIFFSPNYFKNRPCSSLSSVRGKGSSIPNTQTSNRILTSWF